MQMKERLLKYVPVIFLPGHPASFTHKFVSAMKVFISASPRMQWYCKLIIKKIVFCTHKFAVGPIFMGNSESKDPIIVNESLMCKHLLGLCHPQLHQPHNRLLRSRHCVVDKPLALYPRVLSLIPSSFRLSDETKPWPSLHMTVAVCGTFNTNFLSLTELTISTTDSLLGLTLHISQNQFTSF